MNGGHRRTRLEHASYDDRVAYGNSVERNMIATLAQELGAKIMRLILCSVRVHNPRHLFRVDRGAHLERRP